MDSCEKAEQIGSLLPNSLKLETFADIIEKIIEEDKQGYREDQIRMALVLGFQK